MPMYKAFCLEEDDLMAKPTKFIKPQICEFVLEIDGIVKYNGKAFEQYHNKTGSVTSRKHNKGKNFYHVIFEDGHTLPMIQEHLLEVVPQITVDSQPI